MKPSFTFSQTTTFEPTIEQLAHVVAHLDSNDHARLISLIAEITQGPGYSEAMQLQYITDDSALTKAGRRLMEQIGAYAVPLPVARLPENAQVIEPVNRTILVPVPAPIPVSERLPEPEDCLPWPGEPDETPWCWAFVKGPLGDDSWERRPVTCLTTYKPVHTHWLPAHALPLPEVK